MDVRPLLRVVAIVVLVLAGALGLRASRHWPTRRTSGVVAGALAVLALAGIAPSALDLLAPHAPVPDALSVYSVEGNTLAVISAATGAVRWRYTVSPASISPILHPLIDHSVVYLRPDGALRALRAFDQPTPAVDQGVVYADAPASIVALRATDGSPLWQTLP
ncbi:MAG TPA: PQQ-binding-like beta-propeller repeat protein, partial [Ktedonobacterales bacterium]|nr:PQQ-binding-like beta-propeller repeat protein [Ktedonobacterales bacterium]